MKAAIYQMKNQSLQIFDESLGIDLYSEFSTIEESQDKLFSGYYLNEVPHGPFCTYSEEKKILSESWFFEGQRQGKAVLYYLNGKTYANLCYFNNHLHSSQEYFFDNGFKKTELFYRHGKLEGPCTLYHANGKVFRKMNYKDNHRIGLEEQFFPNGMKSIEKYFDEKGRIVKERFWNARGVLQWEKEHIEALCYNSKKFYPTGALKLQGKHSEGKTYEYREWALEGKLTKCFSGFFDGEDVFIQKIIKGTKGDHMRLASQKDKTLLFQQN